MIFSDCISPLEAILNEDTNNTSVINVLHQSLNFKGKSCHPQRILAQVNIEGNEYANLSKEARDDNQP